MKQVFIDFAMQDETTKKQHQINISETDELNDNIVISDETNTIGIIDFNKKTFHLDNSLNQFDVVATAGKTQGNFIEFEIEKITVNPDFTFDLEIKNSVVKHFKIQPDEIAMTSQQGNSVSLYKPNNLRTSVPKNLFQSKESIEGLNKLPSQFIENISAFENAGSFEIENQDKKYNFAQINDSFYLSDGEYLKKFNLDNIKINKNANNNTFQFELEEGKKNISNLTDTALSQLCGFFNVDSDDVKYQANENELKDNPEVKPAENFVYNNNEIKVQSKVEQEKPEQENAPAPKSENKEKPAKEESKPKKETVDLAILFKLIGFIPCLIGLFGGPFLALIIGICMVSSAYAFTSELEKVSFSPSSKPKQPVKINEKDKQKQQDLSKQQLIKKRIDFLKQNAKRLEAQNKKMNTCLKKYETEINKLNLLLISEGVTDKQKIEYQSKINFYTEKYNRLSSQKQQFDNEIKSYQSLIQTSYNELVVANDGINIDVAKTYEEYEKTYNNLLEEKKSLDGLKTQQNDLLTQFNNNPTPEIENQLKVLSGQVTAQEKVCSELSVSSEKLFKQYQAGQNSIMLYKNNMEQSINFKSINTAFKTLNNQFKMFEKINSVKYQKNDLEINNSDFTF